MDVKNLVKQQCATCGIEYVFRKSHMTKLMKLLTILGSTSYELRVVSTGHELWKSHFYLWGWKNEYLISKIQLLYVNYFYIGI